LPDKIKAMCSKAILTALQIFLFSTCLFAQEISPLAETALQEKYPNAQSVEWDKVGKGEYQADFVLNGTEMSVTFDANGGWLETETKLKNKDLPKPVKDYVAKTYPKGAISEVALLEKPTLKEGIYRVEIENNGKDSDLLINQKGEPVE
jgi:hypothetical protein